MIWTRGCATSLDELGRQVGLWQAERNERSVKIHWSFTVARLK